MIIQNL